MKITYLRDRNRFRIIVPARWSGTGKRVQLFFKTKPEAEDKRRLIHNEGLRSVEKLSDDSLAFLQFAKSEYGDLKTAFESLRQHSRMIAGIKKPGATLEQACEAYMKAHSGHHPKTKSKYNSTLNRLCQELSGNMPMLELTEQKIKEGYLAKRFKDKAPGTILTQYRNVHAFVTWAFENHYLAVNPFERSKPPAKWNAKKEILDLESFRKILQACEQNPQFYRLIPFFALGGLAGIRRCELISSQSADKDPRLEWRDILWDKNQIRVRHEVAKETQAEDRRRVIPLEPALRQWLQLVAKTEGPIMAISQSQLQREKEALLDMLHIKVPDNALRNSYASYGCAFRSIGDVARAMGDLEVTIKRYYVDLVDDPELGRAWFDTWPGTKVIPFQQEVA